jgi:phosphate:Na+ symporter
LRHVSITNAHRNSRPISLFLHGLNGFSKEVKQIGSDHFKVWIAKITSNRFGGFFMGIMLTAII